MISETKGVGVHLHSEKGKYLLVGIKKDRVFLTTNRKRFATNILNVRCFAKDKANLIMLAEQSSFVSQIIKKYEFVRDTNVKRIRYQPMRIVKQFSEMRIGDYQIDSNNLINILKILGLI